MKIEEFILRKKVVRKLRNNLKFHFFSDRWQHRIPFCILGAKINIQSRSTSIEFNGCFFKKKNGLNVPKPAPLLYSLSV